MASGASVAGLENIQHGPDLPPALQDKTTFLVDERDGNFPAAGGFKQLYKIDLTGATDVGPGAAVSGATYNAADGGLLIGGKTIENLVLGENTAAAAATLTSAGITPASSSLFLNIDQLLGSL